MVSATSAIVVIATAIGLLQMCPAPAAVPVIAGAAGGAIMSGSNKRDSEVFERELPPGVNRHDIVMCTTAINDQRAAGGAVKLSDIDESSKYSASNRMQGRAMLIFLVAILVESVPPTCMVLATVLSGHATQEGGPVPVPMGVDSLQYTGVRPEDRAQLAKALGA